MNLQDNGKVKLPPDASVIKNHFGGAAVIASCACSLIVPPPLPPGAADPPSNLCSASSQRKLTRSCGLWHRQTEIRPLGSGSPGSPPLLQVSTLRRVRDLIGFEVEKNDGADENPLLFSPTSRRSCPLENKAAASPSVCQIKL